MGHVTGVMGNGQRLLATEKTIAHTLAEAGYVTQAIGKMHFGPVRESHGFLDMRLAEEIPTQVDEDEYLSYLQACGYSHVLEPNGTRHEYYYIPQVSQLPDGLHSTTWIGDRTVDFIQHAPKQPWFLFTSFIKPHPPFDPTLPFLSRYDPQTLPDPDDWDQLSDPAGFELLRAQDYSKWMERCDLNLAHLIKAAYYASITQLDVQIGRILDALERAGMRDNTMILFSSDHGELLGDHHHFGKRSYYQGSTRVPLMISWPGTLPEDVVRKSLVGHQDFYAAFAEAAGLGTESWLLDVARHEDHHQRTLLVGELFEGSRAVYMAVSPEWKYVYSPNGGRECLLAVDGADNETMNWATEHQVIAQSMRRQLAEYFQAEGYGAALTDDHEDLLTLPATPIQWQRNRQYPAWKKLADLR
jgi:arylsulfatase A-like enzyme